MKNAERSQSKVQLIMLGLLALAALALRLYYVRATYVAFPIRGDALQYRAYAWNLIHHHVFSGMLPYAPHVVPDTFRDPGYPTLLALLAGHGEMDGAYLSRVLDAQCVLSALTGWLFSILARRWIGFGAALGVAIIFGLWPHTITLAGYQLSETLLGFLIAVSLYMTDQSIRRQGIWRPLAAGASYALAGLTNAVVAPFGLILAATMVWRDPSRRGLWVLVFVGAAIPLATWSLRSAIEPAADVSSASRAKMNFVQGSWPEYHPASREEFKGRGMHVAAMAPIDDEYQSLRFHTFDGLEKMSNRMAAAPERYLSWYMSKPIELWAWDIGVGFGDIYVYPTSGSPLGTVPILRAATGGLYFLWPFVLLLASAGAILAFLPTSRAPLALRAATGLVIWITLIYLVFQSDVRYSTPFRGIELVLAAYALREAQTLLGKRSRTMQQNRRNAS